MGVHALSDRCALSGASTGLRLVDASDYKRFHDAHDLTTETHEKLGLALQYEYRNASGQWYRCYGNEVRVYVCCYSCSRAPKSRSCIIILYHASLMKDEDK